MLARHSGREGKVSDSGRGFGIRAQDRILTSSREGR
jgi:hypothetical protein